MKEISVNGEYWGIKNRLLLIVGTLMMLILAG